MLCYVSPCKSFIPLASQNHRPVLFLLCYCSRPCLVSGSAPTSGSILKERLLLQRLTVSQKCFFMHTHKLKIYVFYDTLPPTDKGALFA